MNNYKTVSRAGWPAGSQIVVRNKGAFWTADQLSEIDGWDPIMMRVSGDDFDVYDDEGPGEYLLLPDSQADEWRAVVKRNNGNPAAVMDDLRGGRG